MLSAPIGTVHGPEPFALHWPRRPLLHENGLITVATDNRRIRVFAAAGTHVRTIGRPGEGPGEFRQLQAYDVLENGDFLVIDAGRLVLLDSLGTELERKRIVVSAEANAAPAFTARGNVIVIGSGFPRPGRTAAVNEAVVLRDTVDVTVYGMHEDPFAITRVAGMPWWGMRGGYRGVPLGPWPSIAAFDGLVAVSEGDRYDVILVRLDGSGRRVLRLGESPPPGENWHLDRWLEEYRKGLEQLGHPRSPPLYPPGFHPMVPKTLPAYRRLLFDDLGCLWAQRQGIPGSDTVGWDVLDPAGVYHARITVPANLAVAGDRGRRRGTPGRRARRQPDRRIHAGGRGEPPSLHVTLLIHGRSHSLVTK